jgi:hypothetical protein
MATSDPLRNLMACVRPVVFETSIPDAPYSTAGTCFVVGYEQSVYAITAKHVVAGMPLNMLHVFPTDDADCSFDLSRGFVPDPGYVSDECIDLVLLRIESTKVAEQIRRKSRLIRMTAESCDWQPTRDVATFMLLGYPNDKCFVDYEEQTIHTGQVLLRGAYSGPSDDGHAHRITVENPLNLPSFSGFSGGPVFSLAQRLAMPSNLTVCGVALAGTSESLTCHFLDSAVLLRALAAANAA